WGDFGSPGERGAHGAGGRDCRADPVGDGMRADWVDVDRGGESLRELDGVCDGDERAAAGDGEEDGRGRGGESGGYGCGGADQGGDRRDGSGCAAGNVRESGGDSAGISGAASGRTRVAA